MLRTVTAIRYLVPLREGGSLPAIVEADDNELYVMKFAGAGQGPKVLVAELIAGELARALGFRVPELVLMELDAGLGRNERDPEIRDLINASVGLNLGLRYLPSAFAFNPMLEPPVTPAVASALVWFDAYTANVDRTTRNVNLLLWQNELWLIDQGAAFYFHYDWATAIERSQTPFTQIGQHVMLPWASALADADARLRPQLNAAVIEEIVAQIPAVWLAGESYFADAAAHRAGYIALLMQRLAAAPRFVDAAIRAHTQQP